MAVDLQIRTEHALGQLAKSCLVERPELVIASLNTGLNQLRSLLVKRLHNDVEAYFGVDSMMAPLSEQAEVQEMKMAEWEIELYSIFLAAEEATTQGYFQEKPIRCLEWLIGLRHGKQFPPAAKARLHAYSRREDDAGRRLLFSSVLQQTMPESIKAPLVIYRLYPRAVRLATANAFGDTLRACELRSEQQKLLPAVEDCQECLGRPIENGELCRECGNPLWKIKWLCEVD